MLEIAGLTCRFGDTTAVDDVTFDVVPGRICGLIGRNGAGKTTTMRAVLGLVIMAGGALRWEGQRIGRAQRRRFGYFPARGGLYPNLAVAEQLSFIGRVYGMGRRDAAGAAAVWLERMGVADKAEMPSKLLSTGEAQRVLLAACFLHRPVLAVLDEPFASLDFENIAVLRGVLFELADEGCAVLLSSHNLDVLENVCDDVAILDAGRLVEHGALEEIRGRAGAVVVVRFRSEVGDGWAGTLGDVEVETERGGGPRSEVRRGWLATVRLGPSADREAVVAAAAATGEVVEVRWGPARLRDLYAAFVVERT